MENYNNTRQNGTSQESSSSYREILEFFWRLRWWIILTVVFSVAVGFFYTRMQTPVFERQSWIMLNKNDGSNADLALLANLTGRGVQKKIDNEIFILKTPSLMQKVVEDHVMNMRYFHYGAPVGNRFSFIRTLMDFKRTEYYKNSPFLATFEQDSVAVADGLSIPGIYIEFKNKKATSFSVKKLLVKGKEFDLPKESYAYGEPIEIDNVKLYFTVVDAQSMIDNRDRFVFTYTPSFACAQGFLKNLDVQTNGKAQQQSDVVTLLYKDAIPRRAEDILNSLLVQTNIESRSYANMASVNTIRFIDKRLAELASELGNAESNYKQYQSTNVALDLESQSQIAITSDMTYQNQLVEVRLQLRVLDMISDYLNETPVGEYRVIPTNIGISDVGLNSIIGNYNEMVANRNRMVANSSENNPRVLSANTELADGRKSIELSISNLLNVYHIRERELVKTLGESKQKMASIPQQQFEVQQLSRKINIIEPLYVMLQEKREEAQVAMYSQADNFRLIEPAFGSSAPISPRTMQILLLSIIIGFCIPPALVWLRMQLKTKVETKADVLNSINVPVIAVLPRAQKDMGPLIPKDGRDTTSESFRMLRSNLQYLPDCQVIQVTSSIPGEGKSYVSSNLALSIAHTGKRVLLIGMDIRKPVLNKIFAEPKLDKSKCVVGYLIGKCHDLDSMVMPSGYSSRLDVIFAGPVPPNPTELLSQGKEKEIIEHFRGKYDYIIIDSAPYLPVSDSSLINPYVDATLYTVRANYTDLKLLADAKEAIESEIHPVKNVKIVLNDLDVADTKYRYGYGAGYGYGYGYGHGYGYGYGHGYGYGYGYGYGFSEEKNDKKKEKEADNSKK